MSWHFSQALDAAFSGESSLGGAPSAPWSSTPFAADDSCSDKMKDTFHRSPFGMMFAPSTESRGAALLTLFRADSLARRLAPQELAPDSKASEADCGRKCGGSLAKYDPLASGWKTAQCSLLGDSDEFSETWPKWGSMRNGELLERTTPMLRTSAKEYGFWPTVRATDGERGGRGDLIQALRGNSNRHFKARDGQTSNGASGRLNPMWIDWFMGLPMGWTGSEPLEMDKFQEWQLQHGEY